MRALETSSDCESRMILAAGKADPPLNSDEPRNRRVSSLRCWPRGLAPAEACFTPSEACG
ncbi:MAG: hypothetical protein JWN06_1648 [Propionibacteriaceae bacterium]|jgi:hypothetical protein|nr:hypothetical protein [Propionibacteriaceae bacterium]